MQRYKDKDNTDFVANLNLLLLLSASGLVEV